MVIKSIEKIEYVACEIMSDYGLGIDARDNPIAILKGKGNVKSYRIRSKAFRRRITKKALEIECMLSKRQLDEVQQIICDHAEAESHSYDVHHRVAPIEGGIEIDMGDTSHTRVRVSPNKVDIVTTGSDVLFYRPATMEPFVKPAKEGDLDLLFPYLNFEKKQAWLLIGWMALTLSTPRSNSTSYPILALIASQGSSKSTTSKLIIRGLVDPSKMGLQGFPSNRRDIVLAANNAHLLAYDNLRKLTPASSDFMCIASSGGSDPTRKLYTDDELVNHPFQTPLVLNGIHDFIEEPDLAQRCVRLEMKTIPESLRRDEKEFTDDFLVDAPKIFRGLLELISKIMERLPSVTVTHPQRMISYVKYLAAIEDIANLESGSLQATYSEILDDAQRDVVLADPLASVLFRWVRELGNDDWKGTPSELRKRLVASLEFGSSLHKGFPDNAIALSKRLKALSVPLLSQGIEISFSRGRERQIHVIDAEAY
jgi:hypothetical protein